jgi:four helix bundle protein
MRVVTKARNLNGEKMSSGFRDIVAWQKGIGMCVAVYELTSGFPPEERFGLASQLRRAAVSVPSNIAEGYGRASKGEYLQALGIARGSNSEVETQIEIARLLGYGKPEQIKKAELLCKEAGKLVNGIMASLREKSLRP